MIDDHPWGPMPRDQFTGSPPDFREGAAAAAAFFLTGSSA